ncbi:UNVERIFIED_CONTAM: hypothetical protein HHA_236800 [Hammondia hammondi]|eukprot:XP_008885464.1 hypothetical protein HHA_236800 [Hammondia hammondi]
MPRRRGARRAGGSCVAAELNSLAEATAQTEEEAKEAVEEEEKAKEADREKEDEGSLPHSTPLPLSVFADAPPTPEEQAQVRELENVIADFLAERARRRQLRGPPSAPHRAGGCTPGGAGAPGVDRESERSCQEEGGEAEEAERGEEEGETEEGEERERKQKRRRLRGGEPGSEDENGNEGADEERGKSSFRLIYDPREKTPLRINTAPTQFDDRPTTIDPEMKRKLVRRTVMILLFAVPYATKLNDLREVILVEQTVKKVNLRAILKEAARVLRTHLGLLLRRIGGPPGNSGMDCYYLSQGVVHARHTESLTTEREHQLRGFLLFLVPGFIACRGSLHVTELKGYLTACGRSDIIRGFSEADLAGLALPETQKVLGKSLKESPPRLETLWDFLLECRLLKYLSFYSGASSDSNSQQLSCVRPTSRLRDELSLENFRKECRAHWSVRLPSGDLFGHPEVSSEEEASEAGTEATADSDDA